MSISRAEHARLVSSVEAALDLTQADPARAASIAESVLVEARRAGCRDVMSAAERALGHIATGLEDLRGASRHLHRALRYAQLATDDTREAQARMSLGLVLVQRGRAPEALAQIEQAAAVLRGRERGRLLNQRAAVLFHLGRFDDAADDYTRAIAISRRARDGLNLARLLSNRGVLNASRGRYRSAEHDLTGAVDVAEKSGQTLMGAGIRQNLGWLAAVRGDVPAALRHYADAEEQYRPYTADLGTLLLDRCQVMISARLLGEATENARRAVQVLDAGGLATARSEALLFEAEVALLTGDATAARVAARSARKGFRAQRRAAWIALADYALVRATLAEAEPDGRGGRDARRSALNAAAALDAVGCREQAMDARLAAARHALARGDLPTARNDLAVVAARRRRGTVEIRTRAWHAEALLRHASGDRRGARSALRAGLRILEEHRALLGATDLRAAASVHRLEIAWLGLRIAVEDARPDEALRWIERSRAGLLRVRRVSPPPDGRLADALTALRRAVQDVDECVREGGGVTAARVRQASIETSIRDLCRRLATPTPDYPAAPPKLAALAARLGSRALLEFVEYDGAFVALTLVDGRARLHRLAAVGDAAPAVRRLVFLLDRQATTLGETARTTGTAARIRDIGAVLDGMLLGSLHDVIGDRELVIVPTGVLQSMPWAALPSCRGRPVSVTPSATVWFETGVAENGCDRPTVLVCGPGLPAADREIRELAGSYPGSTVLRGPEATTAATLAALDGAGIAHVAAHGSFRADSPMFSSIRLADGPLTVYEFERLHRAPATVVLSACDAARADVRPGDELLGLTAALLVAGTRSLVAPLIRLADDDSADLMLDLHRRLRGGSSPARALSEMQVGATSGTPSAVAAAAGLLCLGSG